jgi:hypothetical protein
MTGHTARKGASDKVEVAHRRGDLFEKRRLLIADWAGFLRRQPAEVVPLAGERVGHAEAPG